MLCNKHVHPACGKLETKPSKLYSKTESFRLLLAHNETRRLLLLKILHIIQSEIYAELPVGFGMGPHRVQRAH